MIEAWLAFQKNMERTVSDSIHESEGVAHICDY